VACLIELAGPNWQLTAEVGGIDDASLPDMARQAAVRGAAARDRSSVWETSGRGSAAFRPTRALRGHPTHSSPTAWADSETRMIAQVPGRVRIEPQVVAAGVVVGENTSARSIRSIGGCRDNESRAVLPRTTRRKTGDVMRSIATGIALGIFVVASALGAENQTSASGAANPMAPDRSLGGYLAPSARLSSLALVPPPPAPGSAAMARDEEVNRQMLDLQGSPRWQLAIRDAVLTFPQVAGTFSCALGVSISQERTPRLMTLLRRTLVDAGRSTSQAKDHYQRARPFMVNGKPLCTPDREDALRANGSYPSGHSAIGMALALVLAELAPDRADALIARGREFGRSRLVCNVHWSSDVIEGQLMGAAVVARLHAEPDFRADLEAARTELAALRTQASAPNDCTLEAQALRTVH
jgi:acid phosphatase (class A)